MTLDGFWAVAATTMTVLAIAELHAELVTGAAAWAAGWWLLREPGPRPGHTPPHTADRQGPSSS